MEGRGRVPKTGCSSASCPLVSWMPGRQAALRRKVAQLAGQVCLSSNRTQEEALGVLTPSCWPGRRHLQSWEACLQAAPRGAALEPESTCWGPSPPGPCINPSCLLNRKQGQGPPTPTHHPTLPLPLWARRTFPGGWPFYRVTASCGLPAGPSATLAGASALTGLQAQPLPRRSSTKHSALSKRPPISTSQLKEA